MYTYFIESNTGPQFNYLPSFHCCYLSDRAVSFRQVRNQKTSISYIYITNIYQALQLLTYSVLFWGLVV